MLSNAPFVCPADLLEKASKAGAVPTAIVGAGEAVALESARRATVAGLIEAHLVGEPAKIAAAAEAIGWDLEGVRIVEAEGEESIARLGASLAKDGEVKALMKGHVHTDALMRAVLERSAGLRTRRRVSHIFYMTVPGRSGSLTITDGAVNVHPSIDQRLDIIQNAVNAAHALGNPEPRVAVLSGSEVVSDAMPSTLEAAEISRRAAEGEVTGAIVEGPLALDAAISPAAAALKGIDTPVAGRADIVLVPNIETGNVLFKSLVYFASAAAAGLVLGARVPIILTSRADPPEARLAASALAAIVAGAS